MIFVGQRWRKKGVAAGDVFSVESVSRGVVVLRRPGDDPKLAHMLTVTLLKKYWEPVPRGSSDDAA